MAALGFHPSLQLKSRWAPAFAGGAAMVYSARAIDTVDAHLVK
jgi:hypothetical protein